MTNVLVFGVSPMFRVWRGKSALHSVWRNREWFIGLALFGFSGALTDVMILATASNKIGEEKTQKPAWRNAFGTDPCRLGKIIEVCVETKKEQLRKQAVVDCQNSGQVQKEGQNISAV
jgi:hypothetical protein